MSKVIIRPILSIALILGLMAAGSARGADLFVGPGETYATIQAAVDAAAPTGDTIHVAAGVYLEQVLVDGKSLAILGAGEGLTNVVCPASIQVFYTTSYDHYPVVGVQGGDVDLSGLTIDGAGQGDAHQKFFGVDYHDAGGAITDVTVTGVRDTPFSGVQHGVSVYCYNSDGTARALLLDTVTVTDYQKNAMALFASPGSPLALTVQNCETVGAGPTTVTAQNGIQIEGTDITADVNGNTVRDVAWDGASWTATGLILYDCSGTFTGNTISGCQTGAWFTLAPMVIANNEFTVPRVAGFGYGLIADNYVGGFKASTGQDRRPQDFDPDARKPRADKATVAYAITGNTFSLDPTVDDPLDTVGLWLLNEQGTDDLVFTATDNDFTGFDLAAYVNEYPPTDGAILTADLSGSSFAACATGVLNDAPLTALAENAWWGAVNGPGGEGPGSGAAVIGPVDYDPWITDIGNLICVPDLLEFTEAVPTGTMLVEYTGGASGRVYGFSIDVFWDPAVVTATADDFVRPPEGAFSAIEFFFARELGPGHVRVDAAIGGMVPGVYADQFFQADFTANPGAPEGAETIIDLAVVHIRDYVNTFLDGLVPAPGLIRVDVVAPQIPAMLVTDTTLPSVDWTRDGHDLQVEATVLENDLATLTCDLTAFGGPVLQLADATVSGDLYTWTWGPVSGAGDGSTSAVVTATDHLAQSATLSDAITADNTAPDALAGLAVNPGHEQIHLAWTEPTPDGGSPLQGVVFRQNAWGDYPHYVGALPIAPTDVTAGDPAGAGPQIGSSWDWSVLPRDVYAVAGFVVDLVGNASPAGDSGLATNYWLGDTDGDGYVTVVPDIHAMGDTYGLTFGEPGYNDVCDVGPTVDYSPRGIPNPQTDGFEVQFEDLVLFAMNYGEVDPTLEALPSMPPVLNWQRLDDVTWVLRLDEPCPALKAVNVQSELPAGVGCQVTTGALLAAQEAPVFLRNIPAAGLDAGLAVMGRGVGLVGTGELMRVTVDETVETLTVTIDARDLENQSLLVEIDEPTGVDALPRAHRLAQNVPNPFNPATVIAFELPRSERVSLVIYAVDGRRIRTLLDGDFEAGPHEVTWQGRDQSGRQVATGTYFYALRAGDFERVRKMTLVK